MNDRKNEPYQITIEIVNRQCKGLKMIEDAGIQEFSFIDIRGLPGDSTRHLVRLASKDISKLPRARALGRESKEGASASFDTNGCDVCNTILANKSFLISGRSVADYTILYDFVVPSFDAFKRIVSTLEAQGLKPKILEVAKFKRKGKALTEKQERALWLALKIGFFEYPRKITMLELSRRLGVGLSTLSEIIRRGTRRLLEDYFEG